jgi:hypothetical protein
MKYKETHDGYVNPFLVDIRFKRTGHAKGFIGNALKNEIGKNNYLHIKELGNQNYNKPSKPIKIASPKKGITVLYDKIIEMQKDNRRVIFFCHCENAKLCHRTKIAKLLLKIFIENKKKISIIEWPGKTSNNQLEITLDDDQIKKLKKTPSYFKIPDKFSKLHIAPWGTKIIIESKREGKKLTRYISHAMFKKESWQIMPLREMDEDGELKPPYTPTTAFTIKDDLEKRGIIEYIN